MKNKFLTPYLIAALISTVSLNAFADRYPSEDSTSFDTAYSSVFTSYEANGDDYILGFGGDITFKNHRSNLGFSLTTSFNNAEVLTEDGYIEHYTAWEGGVRVGYFSDIFVYGEVGVDLTEILFDEYRYDNDTSYFSEYHDDYDAYIGMGAGIDLGHLKISAFSRLREIDSQYWEAKSTLFTGFQISLSF